MENRDAIIINLFKEGLSLKKISQKLKCGQQTVANVLKRAGFKWQGRRIHFYDESVFEQINTEEKAYWLGFICADGCVSDDKGYPCRLSFYQKDKEIPINFIKFIKGTEKLLLTRDKYFGVQLISKKLCTDLVKLGVTPRKSLTLSFNSVIKNVPSDFTNHFIRGYFDGDGGVCITKNRLQISIVGTKEFISELQSHLNKTIGVNKVSEYQHGKNTFEIKKEGKQASRILDYMYENNNICLTRKFEKYNEFKSSAPVISNNCSGLGKIGRRCDS